MIQEILKVGLQIIGLLFLQLLVFSNINFMGHINPYPYVFLFLIYRLNASRTLFLFVAFAAGLILDLALQSPGAHTIALLTTSFVRTPLIQITIGVNSEYASTIWESGATLMQQLNFLAALILVHHLTYFSVSFFSWSAWTSVVLNTITSGLFTFLILWLTLVLYQKNR